MSNLRKRVISTHQGMDLRQQINYQWNANIWHDCIMDLQFMRTNDILAATTTTATAAASKTICNTTNQWIFVSFALAKFNKLERKVLRMIIFSWKIWKVPHNHIESVCNRIPWNLRIFVAIVSLLDDLKIEPQKCTQLILQWKFCYWINSIWNFHIVIIVLLISFKLFLRLSVILRSFQVKLTISSWRIFNFKHEKYSNDDWFTSHFRKFTWDELVKIPFSYSLWCGTRTLPSHKRRVNSVWMCHILGVRPRRIKKVLLMA